MTPSLVVTFVASGLSVGMLMGLFARLLFGRTK